MTIAQAAVQLNRSEVTIRRWIKLKRIKANWIDYGRRLNITQEEVNRIKYGGVVCEENTMKSL